MARDNHRKIVALYGFNIWLHIEIIECLPQIITLSKTFMFMTCKPWLNLNISQSIASMSNINISVIVLGNLLGNCINIPVLQ